MEYLENRGLDSELAVRMGWSGAKTRDGAVWVKIPFRRGGKTINHKYRDIGQKRFRNDPNSEHDLWNVDCLADQTLGGEPVFVTEGEMDALALLQVGCPRAVSMPDGWTEGLEDEHGTAKHDALKRNEAAMRAAPFIVAAVDDDPVGASLTKAIVNFFEGCDVRYVRWPEGCKDANDTLRLHGPEALRQVVAEARRIDPVGGVISGFSDLPPTPPRQVWRPGIDVVDKVMAFRSRGISVMTGIPSAGKSTFALWAMHHLVRMHDLRVGLVMMESDPEAEVLEHLIRLNTGVSSQHLSAEDLDAWRKALDRNYRVCQRQESDDAAHGLAWLKSMVHTLAARDGCNVIVVDPWNEIEHMPEPGESMTGYINFALMKLRQWSERYDVHIVVVAHPKKIQDGRRPGGYDIADSAAFFNKPDMGWTVHIEKDDARGDHVSLTCWKVRSRQQTGCRPGFVRLEFDPDKMVYRRLD